jgi:hypothetical protein
MYQFADVLSKSGTDNDIDNKDIIDLQRNYLKKEQEECGRGVWTVTPEGTPCNKTINTTNLIFHWTYSIFSPKLQESILYPADILILTPTIHKFDIIFDDPSSFNTSINETIQLRQFMIKNRLKLPTSIYYRTTTRLCGKRLIPRAEEFNGNFTNWNTMMKDILHVIPGLKIFDAWRNKNSCKLYDDAIHSAQLAKNMVLEFMHEYCPSIGILLKSRLLIEENHN